MSDRLRGLSAVRSDLASSRQPVFAIWLWALLLTMMSNSWAQTPPQEAEGQPIEIPAAADSDWKPVPLSKLRRNASKVGLVLGGGGALGLAHIGVLKVLQEERVPVDLVTGTSMGALVGGGYAAGHAPQRLENMVRRANWADLFSARAPRADLNWRRKEDDQRFGRLEVGIGEDGSITIPRGVIGGHSLQQYFREIAAPVRDVRDLDQLPLPFRSVATDLVTGKPVVLRDVSLDVAMRASMAVPAAFTPVELGDKLLVDGGLLDNLPIDVARSMGAKRVIAVRVGSTLQPRAALSSALGVAQQVISLLVEQNERSSLATLQPQDVLIEVETDGIGSADFDDAEELIARGEAAARKVIDKLRALAVSERQYVLYEASRTAALREEPAATYSQVRVEGTRHADSQALNNELAIATNQPVPRSELAAGLNRLFGRNEFERIDYDVEPAANPEQPPALVVKPIERPWGRNTLRFGGSIASNLRDSNSFTLVAGHSMYWVNHWGAEWRNEVQLGDQRRFASEFYQPLAPGSSWFLMPQAVSERSEYERFDGDRVIARFENLTRYVALQLGYGINGLGVLRGGYGRGVVETSTLIGAPQFASERTYQDQAQLRLTIDTLDNPDFPRSGQFIDTVLTRFGSTAGTSQRQIAWDINAQQVITVGRDSARFSLRAAQAVQEGAVRLGGVLNLSGTKEGRLSGSKSLLGSVLVYRNVAPTLSTLSTPVYVGGSLEAGNAVARNEQIRLNELEYAVSAFVGVDSLVGPLYFAVGHTLNRTTGFYLFWGRRR